MLTLPAAIPMSPPIMLPKSRLDGPYLWLQSWDQIRPSASANSSGRESCTMCAAGNRTT